MRQTPKQMQVCPPYSREEIVFLRSYRRFDEVHQGARTTWHPDWQHEVKFELYRR